MHLKEEILNFHCGVCAKKLTDATCLFTTCGHFFCFTEQATCTHLHPSAVSGRCEQCGQKCDAGTLDNRASLRDVKVQSYIFSDVVQELKTTAQRQEAMTQSLQTTAEIIKFRNDHLKILSENVSAQQKQNSNLKAQYQSKLAENQDLRRENQQLRSELARQKNMKVPAVNLVSPTVTHSYYKPNESDEVAIVQLDPPARTSMLQAAKRRGTPHEPTLVDRRALPNTRTRTLPEQTYDRSLRNRSVNKRRESQSLASRLRETKGLPRKDHGSMYMKRRTEPGTTTRTFPEQVYDRSLRNRSTNQRRESQSLASRLREAKSVPRKDHGSMPLKRSLADRSGTEAAYRSSNAGNKERLSRFAYRSGESRGAEPEPYPKRQRFIPYTKGQSLNGGWQQKVSNVPRPSATPDKLRRRGKRSMLDVNLTGKRK